MNSERYVNHTSDVSLPSRHSGSLSDFPLIGQPGGEFADLRCRKVDQRLGEVELRVDIESAARAGQACQYEMRLAASVITACSYHKSAFYYSRTMAVSGRSSMLISSGDSLRTLSSILSGERLDESGPRESPLVFQLQWRLIARQKNSATSATSATSAESLFCVIWYYRSHWVICVLR
jgi:hypothetical protein